MKFLTQLKMEPKRPTMSSANNIERTLPVIVDTTLRDGAQMPGIGLDRTRKEAILKALIALGIREIELGCPAHSEEERCTMRLLTEKYGGSCEFSAWCRARSGDIEQAIDCNVSTIHISFPVSDRHMSVLSCSRRDVLHAVTCFADKVVSNGVRCTIGAQDATRAEIQFLRKFVHCAVLSGASRIRIADTVGFATPQQVGRLITTLGEEVSRCALEFHGHNDFGLATANTLAATEAGVDAVSATVLGTGERAGNTPLEQFITAALFLYGYKTDLHVETLKDLCSTVAASFNLAIPENHPIAGKNAFRHESGIHCHGMLRNELSYQPFPPEKIGSATTFSIGPQSGYSSHVAVKSGTRRGSC